jgi:CAAX prenyl protease-like protein
MDAGRPNRTPMSLTSKLSASPLLARAIPFVVFILLTFAQGYAGEKGQYWVYLGKTLVAAWLLWAVRAAIPEMRWCFSVEAAVVGVVVFLLWVGLEPLLAKAGVPASYLRIATPGGGPAWNPGHTFGTGAPMAWFFIGLRLLGSTLLVAPLEEVFFRSFLYRYIARVDFQSIPIGAWLPLSFLVTSAIFAVEHREWAAGLLCGLAYQGLVCWKKRLGDAIVAHAITNFLLGLWVVSRGEWRYW